MVERTVYKQTIPFFASLFKGKRCYRRIGVEVTFFPGNVNVWKVIVRGSFFKEGETNDKKERTSGSCWRPLCIIIPPWYAAPKRPILGCITFRKCAIPGARWLVFHPFSSCSVAAEMLIVVYEPPLLSGWFIDSVLIRAWSPLWNSLSLALCRVNAIVVNGGRCLWIVYGSWRIDSLRFLRGIQWINFSIFFSVVVYFEYYSSCD